MKNSHSSHASEASFCNSRMLREQHRYRVPGDIGVQHQRVKDYVQEHTRFDREYILICGICASFE
jgi:hypothetical protein